MSLRALGALSVVIWLSWACVATYAVHTVFPFNPVRLPGAKKISARTWIPEGWGFFTRDPREERLLLFRRTDAGAWVSASLGPTSRAANAFGLNRYVRAQGVEVGLLVASARGKAWSDCDRIPVECLAERGHGLPVTNTSPHPSLCGEVALILQEPVPWAWSRSTERIDMPSRFLRLNVSC